MKTQALLLAAGWKLDGKGRVANGEETVVCTVPGLSSLVGKSIRGGVLCAAVRQHPAHRPGALCAMCCCFCPSQAEDRAQKSESIQPSLQWPPALGHEAAPQARMGSGSSSSPCTPAPQRALLVQVLLPSRGGSRQDQIRNRIQPLETEFPSGTNGWGLCKPAPRFCGATSAAEFYVELHLSTADQG